MKRMLLIGWMLTWGLISLCQSQEAMPSRDEIQPMSELANSMQVQQLNQLQLSSFEERARQKLKDVFGYISLMQDSSLDEAFRSRAKTLARKHFLSDSAFLAFYTKNKFTKKEFEVVEKQPFSYFQSANSKLAYASILTLQMKGDDDLQLIRVILQKVEKRFGKEVSWVWEIKFEHV